MPHLIEQSVDGDPKSAVEFNWIEGASQTIRSSNSLFLGKIVKPSALHGSHTMMLAHQREHVIPHSAQHIFGLQQPRARDTRTHMQCIQPCHPDQVD